MSDDCDRADIQIEQMQAIYIKQARGQPLDLSNPEQICWNCEAPTDETRRWCCAECRDDWEKEQHR